MFLASMRWFRIRKAQIDPELRQTFERYGTVTMQVCLSTTNYFMHKGSMTLANDVAEPLLAWLTEQYDRAERRETWSLTMEVAITVLVAVELVIMMMPWRKSWP